LTALKNKSIQSPEKRKIQLEAIRHIDKIIISDTGADLFELFADNKFGVS
jgi:glycerol-3-phosphate cytidylyltransferase-like family protein